VGDVVVNYREQAYVFGTDTLATEVWWEPSRIRFDETPSHLVVGATWTERFTEIKRPAGGTATPTTDMVRWDVLAKETVTISITAGVNKTYPDALKVTHTTASGGGLKIFWYASGVGKVKETGGQTEELIDYVIKP
jgi:hypothetical protein